MGPLLPGLTCPCPPLASGFMERIHLPCCGKGDNMLLRLEGFRAYVQAALNLQAQFSSESVTSTIGYSCPLSPNLGRSLGAIPAQGQQISVLSRVGSGKAAGAPGCPSFRSLCSLMRMQPNAWHRWQGCHLCSIFVIANWMEPRLSETVGTNSCSQEPTVSESRSGPWK